MIKRGSQETSHNLLEIVDRSCRCTGQQRSNEDLDDESMTPVKTTKLAYSVLYIFSLANLSNCSPSKGSLKTLDAKRIVIAFQSIWKMAKDCLPELRERQQKQIICIQNTFWEWKINPCLFFTVRTPGGEGEIFLSTSPPPVPQREFAN